MNASNLECSSEPRLPCFIGKLFRTFFEGDNIVNDFSGSLLLSPRKSKLTVEILIAVDLRYNIENCFIELLENEEIQSFFILSPDVKN